MLGPRPGAEAVEAAKQAVLLIDRRLAVESAAQKLPEKELREAAEREKLPYMAVIQLETLHQSFEDSKKAADTAVELENAVREAATKKADQFEWSGRALTSLPRSITTLASSLSFLNLANNQLETLPSAIGALVNLVTLNVQSNHLHTLPDSIGSLSKLSILNVSGNQLKALPDSLANCSKLSELNANFNQLESWQPIFGWKLKNLRKLELHFNNLVGLAESVGHLTALQHLDLRNNRLCSLPSTIGMLKQLETLDVSRNFNNLCSLPASLGELVSLSVLDLSFNQIRELPASLGQLQNLKSLMLDQNPLVVPPKRVVEHSQKAVLSYLLELHQNGPVPVAKKLNNGSSAACLMMIPPSPRHEHAGGWVPVRPGNNTWMRTFLAQFACGNGITTGKTMRWQAYNSDDED